MPPNKHVLLNTLVVMSVFAITVGVGRLYQHTMRDPFDNDNHKIGSKTERNNQNARRQERQDIDLHDSERDTYMRQKEDAMMAPQNHEDSFPLRINEYGTCTKGKGLDKQWLRQEFANFIKVWDKRIEDENAMGTRLMHQFALWATIR